MTKQGTRSAAYHWYVSDERRSCSPKAASPLGEAQLWPAAALLFLNVAQLHHRRRALHPTQICASKCASYFLTAPKRGVWLFLSFLALNLSILHAVEWEMMGKLVVNGASTFKSSVTIMAPDTQPASLWASTSTITPHLYVSTTGKIGIGTMSPDATLHVVGISSFTDKVYIPENKIYVNGGTTGQILKKNAGGWLEWGTAASAGDNLGNHIATMTLDMAGNTFVNVSSVVFNKSVTNYGTTTLAGVTNAGYIASSSQTLSGQLTVNSTVTILTPDGNTFASALWVGTSAVTPHLYVSTMGYVGIGTANPAARLDITTPNGSPAFTINTFTLKPISASEVGLYDSAGEEVIRFDEGN